MMVYEYTFSRKRIADAAATVGTARDALPVLRKLIGDGEQERIAVLYLNAKNGVIGAEVIYVGNVSSALVRVGELFRGAVRLNAVGLILGHNHPSGDATPSPDDLHLTAEALAAGRLLDIDLLDHLVLGEDDTYVSLRERGLAFDRRPGVHGVGEAPREPRLVLRVEDGEVVDDDGHVHDVREAIESIPWVTARKYVETSPHQYVVFGRCPTTAWDVLTTAISKHPDAYKAFYRGYAKANMYWEFEGFRYWRTASWDYGRTTHMVNRCRFEDSEPPRRVDQGARPLTPEEQGDSPPWELPGTPWPSWYPRNPVTGKREYDGTLDPFRPRRRTQDGDSWS